MDLSGQVNVLLTHGTAEIYGFFFVFAFPPIRILIAIQKDVYKRQAPGWSAVRRRAMPAIRCSAALSIVVRLHVPLVFPSKYDAGFLFGLIAADKPILSI